MRRFALFVTGLSLLATTASAQLDCGPGGALCATTKYGLGERPGFRLDKVPADQNLFDYTPADFGPNVGGVSYYHSRGSFISGNFNCGGERGFAPYTGQIHLRERTDCVPTGIGPTCVGGANAGKQCHIVPPDGAAPGYVNPFRSVECPGGTCVDSGGGCRVEIPISDGGGVSPPGTESDALLPTLTVGVAAGSPFVLNAHASQTWGGSSHGLCINGPTPGALCRQHSDCGAGGSCRSTCSGGPTPGALCTTDAECGTGGTCDINRGTCRAGTTPGVLCLQDSDCAGGGTCQIVTCSDTNFRYKPSMGTRYLLPPTHPEYIAGSVPPQTYVRWDYGQVDTTLAVRVASNTALRTHSDDSTTCCQSTQAACNALIPPFNPVYPILNQRTCAVANRYSFEDNVTNDWIFVGGRGTAFYTDPHFVVPGQVAGLCAGNPQLPCTSSAPAAPLCTAAGQPYACCTGAGTGPTCGTVTTELCTGPGQPYLCCTGSRTGPTCGSECGAGDSCSLKETGHRAQIVNGRDGNGDPRPRVCGANLYTLRGTPNQGCTLQPQYLVPGDPGNDCGLFNFGRDRRYDGDCNGVADYQDGCPFLAEWDQNLDSDGDCADGVGGDCRLDECECGDQSGNGQVNVSDLVATNIAIFAGTHRRLCDANSDLNCNVSDIVATNREIFDPDSSSCRHITSSRCGNNVVDPGEACDDGARCQGGPTPGALCDATGANTCGTGGTCARVGGDGCNTSCRLE